LGSAMTRNCVGSVSVADYLYLTKIGQKINNVLILKKHRYRYALKSHHRGPI
jgi:hypothetical protein